jgi:hypothetical protein
MANDSQRDKARATFGKTFFENAKALPNPKNEAAALQKRANDRPIPTYKVGGAVKKATPPQPTAAEREADRKRRESLANTKVTQSEADALGRAMRSEGPRYKDGGKANAGAKRAMKAEQDFTGLMRDAAARAAAKGTPVMKDGGATNEYTAKRVMSRIKAGNFKDGGRAELLRDRRMKDIEKDYKIALAKGKNEGVAKAKYEQRKADAADDYAKRTKADRTATRAAEKASEATLKEARSTKGASITRRDMAADFKKYFADKPMTTKAAEPAKAAETPAKPVVKTVQKPVRKPVQKPAQKIVQKPAEVSATPPSPPAAAAPAAAAASAAAPKPKSNYNAIRSPGFLSGISFGSGELGGYRGRGEISVQPRGTKKVASTAAPITAEERKKRDATYLSTKLAKGGKVGKFAAGGAGKVRKGMMKGK